MENPHDISPCGFEVSTLVLPTVCRIAWPCVYKVPFFMAALLLSTNLATLFASQFYQSSHITTLAAQSFPNKPSNEGIFIGGRAENLPTEELRAIGMRGGNVGGLDR